MKKKYLLNGLAVLALSLGVASCSKESVYDDAAALKHAESVLGLTIDSAQDWKMSQGLEANITVNLGTGQNYTVYVFDKSPFDNDDAVYYLKKEVQDGTVITDSLAIPTALTSLYVSVFDSNNHSRSKTVAVVDNTLTAVFGTPMNPAFTRSMSSPEVEEASAPYDADWVATYLETATEPNSTNAWDNYDNSVYHEGTSGTYSADYSKIDDWDIWNNLWQQGDWDAQVAYIKSIGKDYWLTYTPGTEGYWEYDEDYVLNFKILGTWDGDINVVATEDADGDPRTVVVTGTWNLTNNQRVGGGGRIIVANGGTINISSGVTLSSVNEAQIVVLAGGQITGDGSIEFSNGTSSDLLSGNWGTISVGKFNNNGGNFYNYGTLNTDVMDGGAANSCYYNHGKVNVGSSGSSANIRIYNGCQWNVEGDFRLKMLENTSYFYVGGLLSTIGSEDGTGQDAYVALGDNSLLEAGSLHNTGAIWYGPTGSLESTYAVVDLGSISQLDWAPGSEEDGPLASGYFANNIYVNIHNQDNAISGSAGNQTAKQVFWSVIANGQGQGNGNVTEITDGDTEIIYGDSNFSRGTSGCKPSYSAKIPETDPDPTPDPEEEEHEEVPPAVEQPAVWTFAFEDTYNGDYDMNDVVIRVNENAENSNKIDITLCCTGAAMDLYVYLGYTQLFGGTEVHTLLAGSGAKGKFINTGSGNEKFVDEKKDFVTITIKKPNKKFVIADGDFYILTAGGDEIHVSKYGQDPHGVVIPGKWAWPTEWTCIKDAYPDFIGFAGDSRHKTNTDWYNNPSSVSGRIYQ
ncbi:MAG: DUF4842 domain-containing protein [Prevotella sp.]|nr:DUF4842 domain-containing protein [Prevotella sp.]